MNENKIITIQKRNYQNLTLVHIVNIFVLPLCNKIDKMKSSMSFTRHGFVLLLIITASTLIESSEQDNITIVASAQEHESYAKCVDGMMIEAWKPVDNLSFGERFKRGFVYFCALAYLFIGVSIVSDRFMAAIEVITSKEKEVSIRKADGSTQIVVVRVWNETVANLTLMALGSSAPEILLSIIEIMAKNFQAGDLGPGTIVGSAAYNLFVIIGKAVVFFLLHFIKNYVKCFV